MELNPSCVRDILFVLEKELFPSACGTPESVRPENISSIPPLDNYPTDVVFYHIHQMFSSNLLKQGKIYVSERIPAIDDITPDGHLLLKQLKDKNTFAKFAKLLLQSGSILPSIVSMLS